MPGFKQKWKRIPPPKTIISGVEVSLGIPLFASQSSMDTRLEKNLIDRLIDSLIGWLIDGLIDGLVHCLPSYIPIFWPDLHLPSDGLQGTFSVDHRHLHPKPAHSSNRPAKNDITGCFFTDHFHVEKKHQTKPGKIGKPFTPYIHLDTMNPL